MNEKPNVYRQYERVYAYLSAYLHDDWTEDYETPDAAFEEFLADGLPGDAALFVSQAEALLARPDFSEVLRQLSVNYLPHQDAALDERLWMRRLVQRASMWSSNRG